MNLNDTQQMRGDLSVTIRRKGQAEEYFEEKNMIVNAAKTMLAQLVAGDGAGNAISHIGFGVSGAAAAPDNSSLTSPFWRPLSSHSYPKPGQVKFDFVLATTEANGMSIKEFGLRTTDGALFSRKVRGTIEKNSDISLEGSWTITF